MATGENQYIAPVAFHPGETLAEKLKEMRWDQKNLPYEQINPKKLFLK